MPQFLHLGLVIMGSSQIMTPIFRCDPHAKSVTIPASVQHLESSGFEHATARNWATLQVEHLVLAHHLNRFACLLLWNPSQLTFSGLISCFHGGLLL
jgi:hypothetical protein